MAGEPALVLRVKDVGGTVKSKGGATGALAYQLAPSTISNTVYSQIRDELLAGFRDKGIDVDVQITSAPPSGPPPANEFFRGAAVGAGVLAGVWLLVSFFRRRR